MKYLVYVALILPINLIFGQYYEGGEPPQIIVDSLSCGNIYEHEGNIGMGTQNTFGYRLAVSGGLVAEGIKLDYVNNWPDYVFNENYPLLSLEDLDAYIDENNHLPGIPSAAAISEEGYSLSNMDKLKLKKIEELTLYVIKLEKEIRILKAELEVEKVQEENPEASNTTAMNSETTTYQKDNIKPEEPVVVMGMSEDTIQGLSEGIYCDGKNVGIGVGEVLDSKLAVAGGILADNLRVSSVQNWPDFVFNDEYEVSSIARLANYIRREKHLPGIPRAETIEKEGYSPEEMDALLLERIEVLSLYIISQKKQLDQVEIIKQQQDE